MTTPREAQIEEALRELARIIGYRMNDLLCATQPDYDDSLTGMNEAWELVTKAIDEKIAALQSAPVADDNDPVVIELGRKRGISEAAQFVASRAEYYATRAVEADNAGNRELAMERRYGADVCENLEGQILGLADIAHSTAQPGGEEILIAASQKIADGYVNKAQIAREAIASYHSTPSGKDAGWTYERGTRVRKITGYRFVGRVADCFETLPETDLETGKRIVVQQDGTGLLFIFNESNIVRSAPPSGSGEG